MRPLVILLTPGMGGPHSWAQRVQQRLTERRVILAVRGLPEDDETADCRTFSRTRDLGSLMREIGPALVMPNWLWNTYPTLGLLRARGLDLRIIASCRSDDAYSYYDPIARVQPVLDAIFSVSDRCSLALRARLPNLASRIFDVPTFIDRAPSPAPSRYATDSPLNVLYLGRLERVHKRAHDLVPLASALVDAGVPVQITVAGDGAYGSELLTRLAQVDPPGTVRLIGPIRSAAVPVVLASQQIFVQLSEVEGLSNALLEAMAAGVVPVATPVGGTAQVVRHGVSGFLFPIGDVSRAAHLIAALHDDRSMLSRVAFQAWAATSAHDWQTVGPHLRAALDRVEQVPARPPT